MFAKNLLLTAALRCAGVAGVVILAVGREEFVNREAYLLERVARILGIAAAFLGRYAEIICRNEHLDVSLKLNNREDAYCHSDNPFAAGIAGDAAVKAFGYAARYADIALSESVAAVAYAAKLGAQAYRVGALYFRARVCVRHRKGFVKRIFPVFRRKDFYASLTSVKDALFVEASQTANNGCRASGRAYKVARHFDVESKVYCIKPFVKRNLLNFDETVKYFAASAPYRAGVVNIALTLIRNIKPQIAKTVLIRA